MKDNLTIHGFDLTGMGVGDVVEYNHRDDGLSRLIDTFPTEFVRQVLGSITFGPVMMVDLPDPEDEDDEDWPMAE